ncbi:MAG: hypothetical protein QOH84_348 [Kribbellaceae bacterium]|nr:hypothetical protein [Kribbellaceae bacterium]
MASPWLFRTTWGTKLATNRQADFDAAARQALANMTQGRNTCGMRTLGRGDVLGMRALYGRR